MTAVDRRFLERLNHTIPTMHYADGETVGPWRDLNSVSELDIIERISRRPITTIEAKDIFKRLKRQFRVRDASLELLNEFCPTPPCRSRDMADADLQTHVIRLSRRALALGEGQVVGLLGHEFGHLIDPTPDKPGAERRADALATKVLGIKIRYDRCDLQTIGPGNPVRPDYLHQ